MITIKFRCDWEKSLEIDAETIVEAIKKARSDGADLSWVNLRGANLRGADLTDAKLQRADLRGANLTDADLSWANLCGTDLSWVNLRGADLRGANLDYSCWPLWCGSLNVKIDKRIFCQLLYHTLRAGQSVEDNDIKALLNNPEVLALANQFHRVSECGEIEMESEG